MDHEPDQRARRLAERLRQAADDDAELLPSLDPSAQARVVRALVAESARLRRRRRTGQVVTTAFALAACFALAMRLRAPESATEPRMASAPTAPSAKNAADCGLPGERAAVTWTRVGDRQVLDLGKYGRLAAEATTELQVVRATPCELVIGLTRGLVAAELHDLRPAQLRVQTTLGDVEVHGTTFSVRRDTPESGLEVVLLQGAVDVLADGVRTHLTPNHTLRRKHAARAGVAPSAVAEARALRELLDRAPPAAEPLPALAPSAQERGDAAIDATPPIATAVRAATDTKLTPARSATELLTAAERERRGGRLERARELYREAGARTGGDAEVAFLRWARLELSERQPDAAREVLRVYRTRFLRGPLRAEATWLELTALQALGRTSEARVLAEQLVAQFPESPHAKAARQVLTSP